MVRILIPIFKKLERNRSVWCKTKNIHFPNISPLNFLHLFYFSHVMEILICSSCPQQTRKVLLLCKIPSCHEENILTALPFCCAEGLPPGLCPLLQRSDFLPLCHFHFSSSMFFYMWEWRHPSQKRFNTEEGADLSYILASDHWFLQWQVSLKGLAVRRIISFILVSSPERRQVSNVRVGFREVGSKVGGNLP